MKKHYFVSVYYVHSASTNNILMWLCDVQYVLYRGSSLRLAICACYSWEIAVYIGHDASFSDMQGSKGLWEKAGEISGMKAYLTNAETFCSILNGCYTLG
jgi:hypothetical protein